MRRWIVRGVILALLAGLGVWVWLTFFPTPDKAIRKRLVELAKVASFAPNEGQLAKPINAEKVTSFFTSDIEISVDVAGYARQTLTGRDDLLQSAMAVRSQLRSLSIEFLDINVELGANKESAVANLTLKGRIPSDRDLVVQELKFTLKKIKGEWYIRRVETVRTLS